MENVERTANKAGKATAAKSNGARQYLKKSACGREFNSAPILGKVTSSYKVEKTLKMVLTSGIIKSQKGARKMKTKWLTKKQLEKVIRKPNSIS